MQYLILFLLLLAIELLYFKVADQYNIIDKPNSRSSHTSITLRGGGIIFPIALMIVCFMGYVSWAVTLAVLLVAVVSFIDDIKPLSQLPRFLSHIVAAVLIFYELNLFSELVWILPVLLVLLIGWVNAFNFMDGINGITVLYALTAIISFSLLPLNQLQLPLLISMGLSCIVFGIFNVRKKAKTFAGDVGSISMALFLGYFMMKTIIETGQWGFILFFSIYGIDAGITLFTRVKKRENIFQPHRSHLYQYLANEIGMSHVLVSSIYAIFQLGLNILLINMDTKGNLNSISICVILIVLIALYMLLRQFVIRKMTLSNS